jgi:hypothetical protein
MNASNLFYFKVQCEDHIAVITLGGTVCSEVRGDLLRLWSEIRELKQVWAIFDFTALADPSRSLFVEFFKILNNLKEASKPPLSMKREISFRPLSIGESFVQAKSLRP